MTAPESPAEQPPAESLRERVADALLDADLRRKAEPDAYGQMAAVVIPLVTEDVLAREQDLWVSAGREAGRREAQRQIAEALEQRSPGIWDSAAQFVRSLDLSSPALEEQP